MKKPLKLLILVEPPEKLSNNQRTEPRKCLQALQNQKGWLWRQVARRRLPSHTFNQISTHHKPSRPQEKNHSKNVDHAGGEDAVPCSKKHRLPHKQLNLPPGPGLRLRHLEESKAFSFTSPALRAGCRSGATANQHYCNRGGHQQVPKHDFAMSSPRSRGCRVVGITGP